MQSPAVTSTRLRSLLAMIALVFTVVFFSAAADASLIPHPLDPLTAAELSAVGTAVLASPLISARPLTFHYVGLDEPDKADVLSHVRATASTSQRRAFVIARAGGQSHELLVDVTNISTPSVLSHAIHHGAGFPTFTIQEQTAAATLPAKYLPFVESVRQRGLQIKDVGCMVFAIGWFGRSSEEARWGSSRVAKLQCYVVGGSINFYARPLEGVTLVVDLDRMAIVGYKDRVRNPVPKADGTEYRAEKVGPPFTGPAVAPGVLVQPEGRGFRIDGRVVRYVPN